MALVFARFTNIDGLHTLTFEKIHSCQNASECVQKVGVQFRHLEVARRNFHFPGKTVRDLQPLGAVFCFLVARGPERVTDQCRCGIDFDGG
jgi:hypothetical protein